MRSLLNLTWMPTSMLTQNSISISTQPRKNHTNSTAYLCARFFELMGTLFGFVASDVTSKIDILQAFKQGPNGHHFQTIEDMILYEESENKFSDSKYVSGSRTLLRLHRALCIRLLCFAFTITKLFCLCISVHSLVYGRTLSAQVR